MNFKIISLLTIVFLFLGCSTKVNKYKTSSDILKEQALTLTQKAVIKDDKTIKAFAIVTYINEINHEFVEKNEEVEKFVVSIHIPGDEDQKLYKKVDFRINGKKEYTVTSLANDDALLKILPAVTLWSKYFLVEAPKDYKRRGVSFQVFVSNLSSDNMSFAANYENLPTSRTMGFHTKQ